ncbi:cytochrome P450 [Bombardia bombarda]|uniref:Cytochrome P450 n=1 Tax=Bombardia bombarda TaxID=252184 RepID=A0AA39XIT6_9PEZI|nr:cytochrome P450 [Bombardia bombarda]
MRQVNNKSLLKTPIVPYWVPGLFHSISLFDPHAYLHKLIKSFGTSKPLEVKAAWFRFTILANPEHIKTVFRKSKQVANKSTTLFALEYLLGMPKVAVRLFLADDSGMGIIPRKGSTVQADRRINFLIAHSATKLLQGTHLEALNKRYLTILLRNIDALVCMIAGSSVEAIAGSKLQELYPTFVEDLSLFTSYVPKFLHLLPRWLIPDAFRVRERLLTGIKAWHAHAHQHSDCNKIGLDDPEWEPYFGIKLVRRRQQYALKLKEMTADARATEDLGLLFASTTNVVPSAFWFILEVLRDPVLQSRLKAEVAASSANTRPSSEEEATTMTTTTTTAVFNNAVLVAQPLLQSAYAECLRLYVTMSVTRVAEHADVHIAGYTLPKDSFVVMYSHLLALDADAWTRAGRVLTKPLEEFDAERFLVAPEWVRPPPQGSLEAREAEKRDADVKVKAIINISTTAGKTGEVARENNGKKDPNTILSYDGRRFSMDGLLGLWIPYGGGDHICPGRHFAKQEIILTFAALFTLFDIELAFDSPDAAARVHPDMKHAPFGALPPVGKVPFRMRRKVRTETGGAV